MGLERVAKARRDPAIVAPVKAALEVLAAIFVRLKGDLTVLPAATVCRPLDGGCDVAVPRERAYHDALRDLAVPAMGHPPLVRITVLDDDPEGAYAAWDRGRPSPRR